MHDYAGLILRQDRPGRLMRARQGSLGLAKLGEAWPGRLSRSKGNMHARPCSPFESFRLRPREGCAQIRFRHAISVLVRFSQATRLRHWSHVSFLSIPKPVLAWFTCATNIMAPGNIIAEPLPASSMPTTNGIARGRIRNRFRTFSWGGRIFPAS